MVGANKSRFKPTVKAILERDYKQYRGKGGIEPGEADDPLLSGGVLELRGCPSAGPCLTA